MQSRCYYFEDNRHIYAIYVKLCHRSELKKVGKLHALKPQYSEQVGHTLFVYYIE